MLEQDLNKIMARYIETTHEELTILFNMLPREVFNDFMFENCLRYTFKFCLKYSDMELNEKIPIIWECIIATSDTWDPNKGRYMSRLTLYLRRKLNPYKRENTKFFESAISIETPTNEDGGTIGDTLSSDCNLASRLNIDNDLILMYKLINELKPRYCEVMLMYANGKTYEEIGLKMGVSRQRIQQIYAKSIEIMRVKIKKSH